MTRAARVAGVAAAAWFASTAWAPASQAQEYLIGASVAASSGIEGGDAQGAMYRTRSRLRFGADLRVDEDPEDILEFGLVTEIEPKSGVGADLRYARAAGPHFVLDAGVTSILWPASIIGATVGLSYRIKITDKSQVTLGPEGDFYFLGSDLPGGTMLWQVRFVGGFRVDL